jgi:hypothetical protein
MRAQGLLLSGAGIEGELVRVANHHGESPVITTTALAARSAARLVPQLDRVVQHHSRAAERLGQGLPQGGVR